MTTQPTTSPKPASVETLALLTRIAEATEANTRQLESLADWIAMLHDVTATTANETASTAKALEKIAAGISASLTPAPAPAPMVTTRQPGQPPAVTNAPADEPGSLVEFEMTTLVYDYQNGKPAYKARGPRYPVHGVRVWPEVLPLLGIQEDALKLGDNPLKTPLLVTAVMGERGPRKVLGLADENLPV